MPDRRLEYVPLEQLTPATRNPKGHALDVLSASVGRFGYIEPVVIDERTGRMVAGHGRRETLLKMRAAKEDPPEGVRVEGGQWLVPVLRGWASRSDTEADAYLLASNRLVEKGGWDDAQLAGLLEELNELQALEGVGFDDADLERLLGEGALAPEDEEGGEGEEGELAEEDELPPLPAEPWVKLGDLFVMGDHRLLCGDSLKDLDRLLDGASISAVLTDPPYEIGFMGKGWDSSGIAFNGELWGQLLKRAKPGAHLMAFGATRTYHRMAVAIEDAGWDIRDSLHWVYGTGFPKSLDVSKAIAKERRDDPRPVCRFLRAAMELRGVTSKDIADRFGFHSRMVDHWAARDTDSQPTVPTPEQWERLRQMLAFGDEMDGEVARLNERKGEPGDEWKDAPVVGEHEGTTPGFGDKRFSTRDNFIRDLESPWQGWGTALKPGHEPIVLARKPLEGTVAANVQKHGTGALNIDATRIACDDKAKFPTGTVSTTEQVFGAGVGRYADRPRTDDANPSGRWPANVLLDPDAAAELDEQSLAGGMHSAGKARDGSTAKVASSYEASSFQLPPNRNMRRLGDTGGASRFFYVAKPSRAERGETNTHATVKPLALMRHLAQLIGPPGGVVLEPFCGSGTTLLACEQLGLTCCGMELSPAHVQIAIERWEKLTGKKAEKA